MSKSKKGLGRGLSALLADVDSTSTAEGPTTARRPDDVLPIEKVHPNPDQPRRRFEETDLEELTNSIAEKGILQPLIVRPDPTERGTYQIVAGERRWRAAQRAKLHQVPVVIREFDDTEALEVAIIENIQRADLNAVEEAAGYRQLMDRFGHTQEKLAEALGKSRSHIANSLRLLNLPDAVQAMVVHGKLTAGHARALITADNPTDLAQKIINQGLSVRQTETLAKKAIVGSPPNPVVAKDADTRALEADLAAQLGLKVSIAHKGDTGAGEVRISYRTLEDLDGLCQLLSR